nr:hypothetical protein [Mucilaginibacter sp. E4BP6]
MTMICANERLFRYWSGPNYYIPQIVTPSFYEQTSFCKEHNNVAWTLNAL